MKIGFIGTGVIAEAIVTGLLKARFPVSEIVVSPRSERTARKLSEVSPLVRIGTDNQDVVTSSDVVFLAIRLQIAEAVLRPLHFSSGKKVASLIATVPIPVLREWIGQDIEIARAVPLPFVADLNGVTVVYPRSEVLTEIFSAMGAVVNCETVDEFDAFAVAAALMGTYFGVAETCAEWLCSTGVRYDKAKAYLAPFFYGLADSALRAPEKSFEDLRIGHTTVGGLNEQLFRRFDEAGGTKALTTALEAVAECIRSACEET
ncbi:pyrroline-5-carboxylate reductase [Mesorhizobium sp. M0019]|uniref:pyrroline-5-carboxylate reductase n=1 Tax=Mesorhizobium sp. M0019 TaxID=2956845 RepID=UPI00333AAF79